MCGIRWNLNAKSMAINPFEPHMLGGEIFLNYKKTVDNVRFWCYTPAIKSESPNR